MKPIKFKQHNVVYAENQKEYLPLPVFKQPDDPEGKVTSCWRLSIWERIRVLVMGRLFFQTMTFNQPLQPQLPALSFWDLYIKNDYWKDK